MNKPTKTLLFICLLFLTLPLLGGIQFDNKKTLHPRNIRQLPEMRAKLEDGTMLIIHLNTNFIVHEYNEIDPKYDREITLSNNKMTIKGFRSFDEFKVKEKIVTYGLED